MGRFLGNDKSQIIDQQILKVPISIALEPLIAFIRRHTSEAAEIDEIRRKNRECTEFCVNKFFND
jgi:predicted HTH transcriptional regulator